MKTLKFKSHLVPLVLSGRATSTWRLFDDKNLAIGDELLLTNAETGAEFSRAVITGVREKRIGDIMESDFDEYQRYENLEEMYRVFKGYYGDTVTPESMMKMITFALRK